jgi:hypothetical protein
VNGLVVIRDGGRTCERLTLDQAVERIVSARGDGMTWDVRRRTTGEGYRLLYEDEAAVVVAAVTNAIKEEA